ncbi:unnamed protein product [Polarella glacialis]|nr:unnamed protein product [Polarella glacialis]
MPLPEELKGKPLFPTITYKNVSLDVNFGPTARVPLPFACHMLGGAAAADVEISKPQQFGKSGKPEVVFPLGLPEQGYFDWVDDFVAKNPGYTELSDRKLIEWARKSGVWQQRNQGVPGTNDKPEPRFGLPGLDDWSVSKVMWAIAPTLQRNFIVPELKSNLVPSERQESLLRYQGQDYHRKAVVLMGEPTKDFKERVHAGLLAEKQAKADAEHKKKAQEENRKQMLELRKTKAEEAKKAREAAAAKKAEGAADAEGAEQGEAGTEQTEGEEAKAKDEETGEAEVEETKAEAAEGEDAKMEETAAPVELTEEEKKQCFRKTQLLDLAEKELAKSYASFALPAKAEGFDEISFAWSKEADCSKLLKDWVMEKKLTQRAEDLQPGAGFKEQYAIWQKTLSEWRKAHADHKDPARRKAAETKKAEAAKQKREEDKKALIEAGDEEGAKALDAKLETEAEPVEELDVENLDVFAVENIMDIGNGDALFADFAYEDWVLLSTRYELHLLLHSFKKDLNDPDRLSFGLKHLSYYYNKYYKKNWSMQQFGIKEFDDLVELLKDSVSLDSASGHLKADQAEDATLDSFMKLTEDNRRERQRRIEAGDETARLKFSRPAPAGKQGDKGYGKGGGGKGSYGKGAPAPPGRYAGAGGGAAAPPPRYAGYGAPAPQGGGSYAAQKRPYSPGPPPAYGASKQPRAGGYGAYGGGGAGGPAGGAYRR